MALDPYAELRVARDAKPGDIKKAYRRRIRQVHPDKHPDDPHASAKAQQVQEAYEILSDPARRDRYDRSGDVSREIDFTAAARELLVTTFVQTLKEAIPGAVVSALRATLKSKLNSLRREARKGGDANVRLRSLKERIACRGDENLIAIALDDLIEKNSEQIEVIGKTTSVTERALELLNEYDDIGASETVSTAGRVRAIVWEVS